MKIGLVSPYNMFKGGGVQECVFATQAELQRRGHDVSIITPMPRSVPDGVDTSGIIFLGGATQVKSFHTTAQVSASVNTDVLQKVLDEHDFDIIHFHEPWIPMVSRQILTRSTAINIGTFHAKLPDTVVSKTIERVITPYTKSILSYLDYLTAVSEPAAEYARNLTQEEIAIIPNGIDLKLYKPAEKKKNPAPTILYIGRLEKRKGLKYLLCALKELQSRHSEVRLLIAGDGPDRAKLEDFVDDNDIRNVQFLGYITQENKLRLLQQADVFCSPAKRGESFGIVLLEAMACGTPIVAGDNPGYQTVLKDKGGLSIVDPDNEVDFARRMELFLFDDELRAIWREWAIDYVKKFDYVHVVDQYEELYKTLLKQI